MNKSAKYTYPRPLAELVGRAVAPAFARQGFAATEIVTRWTDIVGPEVAALAQPMRLNWPRHDGDEPATLVLRVEGPRAIEIQHSSDIILQRINRFFGWRAVARIALRQAPLKRPARRQRAAGPTGEEVAAVAASLDVADEGLRHALARLGAAIKRP